MGAIRNQYICLQIGSCWRLREPMPTCFSLLVWLCNSWKTTMIWQFSYMGSTFKETISSHVCCCVTICFAHALDFQLMFKTYLAMKLVAIIPLMIWGICWKGFEPFRCCLLLSGGRRRRFLEIPIRCALSQCSASQGASWHSAQCRGGSSVAWGPARVH